MQSLKLPKWIILWMVIGMSINLWDVGFIFLRPASFAGGSLGAIWLPYANYVKIDTSYLDLNNAFIPAMAWMNLFEITLGCMALTLNYFQKTAAAIVFAFSSLLLTGTKTIFFFVWEAESGFAHIKHNPMSDIIFLYVLPNALWIVFPFLAVIVLGRRIVLQLSCQSVRF